MRRQIEHGKANVCSIAVGAVARDASDLWHGTCVYQENASPLQLFEEGELNLTHESGGAHAEDVAPTSVEAVADHHGVCTYQKMRSARRNTSLIVHGATAASNVKTLTFAQICGRDCDPQRSPRRLRLAPDDQKQQRLTQHPY
jgi:hypothetical protein